jgi:hypothetical protein
MVFQPGDLCCCAEKVLLSLDGGPIFITKEPTLLVFLSVSSREPSVSHVLSPQGTGAICTDDLCLVT